MSNSNASTTTANTLSQTTDVNANKAEVLEPLPKAPTTSKRPKNALTHGIYAEEVVLGWENADDLIKLRKDLWAELQPKGRLEEETVLGIVHDTWLKRRLMRTVNLGYRRDPFGVEVARALPKDWDELMSMITSEADKKNTLTEALKESLNAIEKAAEKVQEINMALFRNNIPNEQSKNAWEAAEKARIDIKFVREHFSEQVFPRMTKVEDAHKSKSATVLEKAYSHEDLEKALRLEAMLDNRIDKQMARLVNLKEYKRLRSAQPKEISNVPSIAAS